MEVPEPLLEPPKPVPPKREVPESVPVVEAPNTNAEVAGEPLESGPEPLPAPKILLPVLPAPKMEVPVPVEDPPNKEFAPVEPKMLVEAVLPPEAGVPKRPEPEVAGLSNREDPEDPKIDLPSSGFSVFSPKSDPTDPLPDHAAPKIEPPEEAPKSGAGALPPPSEPPEAGVPQRELPELGVPKIEAPPEPPEAAVQRAPPEFGAGIREVLLSDPKMDSVVPPNRLGTPGRDWMGYGMAVFDTNP
ncbi:unnamed protein product [Symbiodinium sp. CCMP2592]|nr:unnamed protein product [Symbiodinium sp. CCMP2592]